MRYDNLTQCVGKRMCYFRSTDIEQKNWKRLLWSFPDEMLYFMSLGKKIQIVDKSTKERNKIERIFVPVMQDLLNWLYFGNPPQNKHLNPHFAIAKCFLQEDNLLMTKFMFWKKRIKNVKIVAKTIRVTKERGLD